VWRHRLFRAVVSFTGGHVALLKSGHQFEGILVVRPLYREMPAIKSGDRADAEAFCGGHD